MTKYLALPLAQSVRTVFWAPAVVFVIARIAGDPIISLVDFDFAGGSNGNGRSPSRA